MTVHDLRSLANYHQRQADKLDQAAAVMDPLGAEDLRRQCVWHGEVAKQLTELANTFEACGRLLTNITGNYA